MFLLGEIWMKTIIEQLNNIMESTDSLNNDSDMEELESDESLDISYETEDEASTFSRSDEPARPAANKLHEFIEFLKKSREKEAQEDDTAVAAESGSETNFVEIMSEESEQEKDDDDFDEDDDDGADSLDAFDRDEIEKMLEDGK